MLIFLAKMIFRVFQFGCHQGRREETNGINHMAAAQLVSVPEVSWHACSPILSTDIHYNGLLATGSSDTEIRLWRLKAAPSGASAKDASDTGVEHVQSLVAHQGPVNVVRFSPSGAILASGSDDKIIILWRQTNEADDASWGSARMLRGHQMDICDLSWAPDSLALVSGSVDNRVMVWDVEKLKLLSQFDDHAHYVQGVAWEPDGACLLTVSSDRTCRVYAPQPAGKKGIKAQQAAAAAAESHASSVGSLQRGWACTAVLGKRVLAPRAAAEPKPGAAADADTDGADAAAAGAAPAPAAGVSAPAASARLYLDDSVPTFCRRPAWSPDGRVVLVPCGQFEPTTVAATAAATAAGPAAAAGKVGHTTYVYARGCYDAPIAHLPATDKPTIAARCCPLLFKPRAAPRTAVDGASPAPAAEAPWLPLPHRLVWAVITTDAVLVYDSERARPLALVQHTHLAPLTDLAWSVDGRLLAVTSHDGYVTLIRFEPGMLGEPLPADEQPLERARALRAAAKLAAPAPKPDAAEVSSAAALAPRGSPAKAEASELAAAGGSVVAPAADTSVADAPVADTSVPSAAPPEPAAGASEPAAAATEGVGADGDASAAAEQAKKKKRITPVLVSC
jgi:chromatin assembly factor 1 subunit B